MKLRLVILLLIISQAVFAQKTTKNNQTKLKVFTTLFEPAGTIATRYSLGVEFDFNNKGVSLKGTYGAAPFTRNFDIKNYAIELDYKFRLYKPIFFAISSEVHYYNDDRLPLYAPTPKIPKGPSIIEYDKNLQLDLLAKINLVAETKKLLYLEFYTGVGISHLYQIEGNKMFSSNLLQKETSKEEDLFPIIKFGLNIGLNFNLKK